MISSARGSDIRVIYYSGSREGETPRALVVGGREFTVGKVVSRRRELDSKTGRFFEVFRVQVAGVEVVIRREESGVSEISTSSGLPFLSPRPGRRAG